MAANNSLPIDSSIHKQLWKLALPVMLSNISVPLLGLVDTAILGHLEDSRFLAAVAMGSSLFVLVFWSFAFLRMGTTALVAQNFNQPLHLISTMQSALLLASAIGLLLMLCSSYISQLMIWAVSAVQEVRPLALEYLQVRFYVAPATLINYALLGYFIGLGKTHIPLILLVSTNLLNGILNYVFVYHYELNSLGVAYGSNIAEVFQLILALCFLKLNVFDASGFSLAKKQLSQFLNINGQLFIRTACLLFAFAFFMSQGAQHSAVLLSANAILINLLMFMSNALDGFAIASESMVGKALALRNERGEKEKIKRIIKASGQWSFMCAVCLSTLLLIFHQAILQLLTSQQEVLILLDHLTWWLVLLPLAGFASYWLDGIYIGLAKVHTMRNSILFAVFGLFLPLVFMLQSWEYHGLWFAFFAFLLGRAAWQLASLPSNLASLRVN